MVGITRRKSKRFSFGRGANSGRNGPPRDSQDRTGGRSATSF